MNTLDRVLVVLMFASFAVTGYSLAGITTTNLIRDCSITGVHILDNETVVVCQVVKVHTQEVPSPTDTKPEVTL